MATFRDLALRSRTEVWRDLRGLRAAPPGPAATDKARRLTFQSALEQSQQLMEAAESAGPATRPLQLFYALSQGGRAIAAASVRLPTTATIIDPSSPDQQKEESIPWHLKGHGITAPGTSVNRIGKVTIKAAATGLMPGVARAVGVSCLPPNEPVKLNDLWPLLPESLTAPLATATDEPALSIADAGQWSLEHPYCYKLTLSNIPRSVYTACGDDREKLSTFLNRYPSLAGYGFPYTDGSIGWLPTNDPEKPLLVVCWGTPEMNFPDVLAATRTLKGTRYRDDSDWWIFPSIGSMTEPLHPLMTWWAVLFALSMMARYEPSNWYSMTNIDTSADANAIEHLLDQALDVIPSILLEAIRQAHG